MKEMSLAYVAGILDGEGHISITKNISLSGRHRPYHQLVVVISNTYKPLIEALRNQFGGWMRTCPPDKRGNRVLYRWGIGAAQADSFLRLVGPWLRIKTVQAWLALEFIAQRTLQTGNGALTPEERALREGFFLALRGVNSGKGMP